MAGAKAQRLAVGQGCRRPQPVYPRVVAYTGLHLCNNARAHMLSDPYRNLAEILEGTLSLMQYYARRMEQSPASLEAVETALRKAVADLHARSEGEQAAD